jgi:hypothetical protein
VKTAPGTAARAEAMTTAVMAMAKVEKLTARDRAAVANASLARTADRATAKSRNRVAIPDPVAVISSLLVTPAVRDPVAAAPTRVDRVAAAPTRVDPAAAAPAPAREAVTSPVRPSLSSLSTASQG